MRTVLRARETVTYSSADIIGDMGPVVFLSHGAVQLTLNGVTGQKRILAKVKDAEP